ncbi:lipoprotein NlpI [Catenovulum sp. SM1970]|uniref:lipoprotein NlpI n=1 Tax=Marinifaba aquimaris TaxID=2741323 RepID=UPI001573BAA7|nr:lipoprotein NlpI [Marinifaba aquimaris]NTS75324.1 lipoprotein NlpI [Marinifaba aquimaris]
MKKIIAVGLLSIMGLAGCANTPAPSVNDYPTARPLIALPLKPSVQQELAIKRLTDILSAVDLTEEQRAELHFQRGVRFDAMGLNNLALYDFNQSLKYKQDFVESYNYLGVYYTLNQEFPSAYDAFDSVLELEPEHSFAVFNRGIALYYGMRPELAIEDFKRYQSKKDNDPYRAIWLYLAEREIDEAQAKQRLTASIDKISDQTWAKTVLGLYLERISINQFLSSLAIGVKDEVELAHRLCEAYFYLAKYYQYKQQEQQAKVYFKLALATNVYEFVEHRYATLELELATHKARTEALIQARKAAREPALN